MDQKILKTYEEKGLPCPFSIVSSGEISVSQKGESLKNEMSHMAMIIFETINAIGGIKIDTLEIIGERKGVLMELDDERIVGSVVDQAKEYEPETLWKLIAELKGQESVAAPPKEKLKVKIAADVFDKMKVILKDYLGDFTERIYKNQLKNQRINPDECYDEDARRFIFALGKAAGMIIGPSKGTELTNKLLKLLK